uniref:Uncharacterized protein ORF197 n=1 Tax=Euplotes crassus TaxID=5936 RepID=D1LDR3_EUPCR|nr:hypothetical protein [Moneuplotes crassus]
MVFFFYYLVSWGYTFIDPTLTLHTFTAVQSLFFSNFIFFLFTGIHFIFIFQLFFEYRKQGTYLPLFSKYLFVLTFVFFGFIYCKWSFFTYLFLYFLVISTQPLILKINNLIYLTHLFISWLLIFFVTTLSSPTILNLNVTDNYYLIRLSFFNDLIFSSGHFFFYNQFIVIDYSLSAIHSAIEKRLVGVSVNYRFWV